MASTNFLQHNPTLANQQTDAQYAAEATRTGGIALDQLLASPWLNKVWYQSSTFVAALAGALAAKGYPTSDANLSVLEAVLAHLITTNDLAALGILTNANLPISVANGGTGNTSLAGAGLPQIVAKSDKFNQTATLTNVALITPAAAGFYRMSGELYAFSNTPGVTGATILAIWTQNGKTLVGGVDIASVAVNTVGFEMGGFNCNLYPDAGTPVTYTVQWTTAGGGNFYDVHVRLEALY